MLRRISTKLVLAVLAAVIVPFLAFAFFLDFQMARRLSREVTLYSLKGLAADLSQRVDGKVSERNVDGRLWSQSPLVLGAIDEFDEEIRGQEPTTSYREWQTESLDQAVQRKEVYDLILLVNAEGRLVVSNRRDATGLPLDPALLRSLGERDYAHEEWFRTALAGGTPRLDKHVSPLLPLRQGLGPNHPENNHIGFAWPVKGESGMAGVLLTLVNWKHFQAEVDQAVLKEYFKGLVGPDEPSSAYGWIWGADADTILAHPSLDLHGKRVSGELINLPQLVEAARADEANGWGFYPEYGFRGERKNGAFKRCADASEGGFGWVVGVGIDNDDIYAGVHELRELLYKGTFAVVLIVLLWTMVIARRTTEPVHVLQRHTAEVARGKLETRCPVLSNDELGELARSFNDMTAQLAANRTQLVKAEKDSAWREMARQVAHDIKNPLTPIQLSTGLLRRAKQEGSPEFDSIFERTLTTISRQVDNLRAIASDFYALTGAHKHQPRVFDVNVLVRDVLELNAAWADSLGVRVEHEGVEALVNVDPDQLRRALNNLVSNSLEAMPEGGVLRARVALSDGRIRIEILDTGQGIAEEVRAHLFEPYFTTRSKGTGLGLAIAKRVVEEMDGEIALEPSPEGRGTLARILLPRWNAGVVAGDGLA